MDPWIHKACLTHRRFYYIFVESLSIWKAFLLLFTTTRTKLEKLCGYTEPRWKVWWNQKGSCAMEVPAIKGHIKKALKFAYQFVSVVLKWVIIAITFYTLFYFYRLFIFWEDFSWPMGENKSVTTLASGCPHLQWYNHKHTSWVTLTSANYKIFLA